MRRQTTHDRAHRIRLAVGSGTAAALTVLGVVTPGVAHAVAVPATARPAASTTWSGTFSGFPGAAWKAAWGELDQGSWNLDDGTASGDVLTVKYGKGSSSASCTDCPPRAACSSTPI